MAQAPPIHFTIEKKAREGIYHLRIYSVPNPMPFHLAPLMKAHLDQCASAVELPGSIVNTLGVFDVQTENELEQGEPRIGEYQLDLDAVKELAPLVACARDTGWHIWLEVVLEQHLLDAPVRPDTGSFVWPTKMKNVFWGRLDRKTLKGKVRDQSFPKTISGHPTMIRATRTHDGNITMSFTHWMKSVSDNFPIASALDFIGAGSSVSIANIFTGLLGFMNPAPGSFIADQRLDPQNVLLSTTPDKTKWGSLSIAVSSDGGTTQWTNLADLNVNGIAAAQHPLFVNDPKGNDQSFYRWTDYGQALAELAREVFCTIQIELPTMEAAAKIAVSVVAQHIPFEASMRTLLMPDDEAPLAIIVDPEEDSIEYDPCGAWASSYTIDEPTAQDLLPDPAHAIAKSKLPGGADQSYKTLLRLLGTSATGTGGAIVADARGFEINCKNAGGTMKAANWAQGASGNVTVTDWAALHAFIKINRWGSIRAILTCRSRGVGLEPFGESASVNGAAIVRPTRTYGLNDFSDFPLGRYFDALPGIFSSPTDGKGAKNGEAGLTNAERFTVIAIKRTPDGDSEIKAVEFSPVQFYDSSTVLLAAPPPPPPPPPGKRGGPSDAPTIGISSTGLTGNLSGTKTISVTATNTYGVAQVTVTIDGVMLDTQVFDRGNNVWAFTFDTTKYSGSIAVPQLHTIKAIGYDVGGNTASATLTVTIAN